ncbi:MAG: DUF1934 domain-containing protein [Eubacteriales bacterium]|jgi:uncharacterized beta-barrel protein YwiB (DUF1934 family)|nr:DUF1934 domain-containing protein [Eubacteriales bacterium]
MKDIMLKIIGKQYNTEDKSEEQLEFITEGKLFEKGESTYLMYDESEFSGFPGCKTTLKLTGDCIKMRRIGEQVGYGTEIVFEKGKRFSGRYETPYGIMDMEVLTNDVINSLSKDGIGSIKIDYHVSLSGVAEGRNELNIQVM